MNPEEWSNCRLGEIAEIVMGQSPSGETCNNGGIGVPLLNGPTEFGSHSPSPVQYTSDPKKKSKKNDILFCVRGSTTGRMNWSDQEFAIGRGLAAIRSRTSTDLQYFIKGIIDHNLNQILGASTGSTFPNVSRDQLNNLEIFIPTSKAEQSRIASILSSLDDKIELNLQMNKTLEAIAQAIFKEWFMDFRFPGFDGEMVDGLPKGWRKGHLFDILDLQYGKALKSDDRRQGSYPVIGSSGVVGLHDTFHVKGPGIVIGRKGTIGKVIWIDENFFPIDTTFFIKDLLGTLSLYYHFFLLRNQSFQKISSDSAVPGLNKNEALRNNVIVPQVEIINRYNEIAKPLFEKINLINIENNTLTQLRDSILPKLMTGKIKVA